jgi:hypothetical protein
MKKILTEAVAVGNVSARALSMRPRLKEAYCYPGSAWFATMPRKGTRQTHSRMGECCD